MNAGNQEIQGGAYTGDDTTLATLNKPFWAQVTAYDGSRYYSWVEVVPHAIAGFVALPGGRQGFTNRNPAYDPNGVSIGVPTYAMVRRAYFDQSLDWVYVITSSGSGGGDGAIWAQLVDKTAPASGVPIYYWRKVTPSYQEASHTGLDGCLVIDSALPKWTYADDSPTCESTQAAYEVNGIDLPYDPSGQGKANGTACNDDSIVRLYSGPNGRRLLDQPPRWEMVLKTGPAYQINGITYHDGMLMRYDQTTKKFCEVKAVLVRTATCVSIDNGGCCVEGNE